VHRGYPGLGDVVIIESDAEKVIYSGTFAPAVSQGVAVSAGDVIATRVVGRTVRVSHFAR
jgi:septal ring factor EnvC (AmiA/AmiB activator)